MIVIYMRENKTKHYILWFYVKKMLVTTRYMFYNRSHVSETETYGRQLGDNNIWQI